MDAPYYNGPEDDRNFDPLEPPRCPDCGASAEEPCEPTCGCVHCRKRDWQAQDAQKVSA